MTSEGPGALFGAHQTFQASAPPSTATFQSANYFGTPGDSPPGNPFSSIGAQQPQHPPQNFQFPGTTHAGPTGMTPPWTQTAGPMSQNPLGRYPSVASSDSAASVATSAYTHPQDQSVSSENYHSNSNFALPLGPPAASVPVEPVPSYPQGVPPSQPEGVPPLSTLSQNHSSAYRQFGAVQDSSVSTAGGVQLGQGDLPGSLSQAHTNEAPLLSSSFTGSQEESAESRPGVSMASSLFSADVGSDFLPSSSGQQPQPLLLTHQDQSAQMTLHASGSSSSAPSTTLLCTAQQEQVPASQYSNAGAPAKTSHLGHRQSLPAMHGRNPPLQGEYVRHSLPPPVTAMPEPISYRPFQSQRTATGQVTTGPATNELLEILGSPDEQRSSAGEGPSTGSTPQHTSLVEPRPGSSNSYPGDWQSHQLQPPVAPPTNTNARPERPHSSGDHHPIVSSSTSSPLLPDLTRLLSNAAVSDQQMFLERHESYVSSHATNATNADSQPSSLGSGPRTNADFLPPVSQAVTPKKTGDSSDVATGLPDSTASGQSATSNEGVNTSGVQQAMFPGGVELARPLEQIPATPPGGYSGSEHPTPIEQQVLMDESPLEGELPPSLSSSLNQSVSSLLESQEEFNRMSSPCKILPPAPEGQLSPGVNASHFQVIAAPHHPATPPQRDSNVVNAHQAFSQLPASGGVTGGNTREDDAGRQHQRLFSTLQRGQMDTPSSFAAVVAPVPDAQPSYPPFSDPNLPAGQSSRGIGSASTVPVPPTADGVSHSSELVKGLPEKPADVPPSTQAAVLQPSWPIYAPPSQAANPNPPPTHTANPNPPPSHTANPPSSHAANPNSPPSYATYPNPPPSQTANPNPPPSHVTNLNPPPSHAGNPNPPPSHAANPNPPPSHAANPNPPPSHTANPNPPPSHAGNPPPHQTLTHTSLLPYQPSNPTTTANAQQQPVNQLPPSTQLSSTPETAVASTSVPPVAAISQAGPAVGLTVSQTQTASFFDPTSQPNLTDAMQASGPGPITQPSTAAPTMHQLASNPIGTVPQEPSTVLQAPSLTNPTPPTAAHPPTQLSKQVPQPSVQQPQQSTLQTTNSQAQLSVAIPAGTGTFPTHSTNAAEVVQAPLATSRLPMQPLPQQPATNAELQPAAVVPAPHAQGGPVNLPQGLLMAQPVAQNFHPPPTLPVGAQSAQVGPAPVQTVSAPSAGHYQPQPLQQQGYPSMTTPPQAGQGPPPSSEAPLLSPATLHPQEGGTIDASMPGLSAPSDIPTAVAPVQPQLQSQAQLVQQPLSIAAQQGSSQDAANVGTALPPQQQQHLHQQQQHHPLVPASHGAVPGQDAYVADTGGARERGTDDRGRYDDRHRRYPDQYDQESYDPYYAQERLRHPAYYDQGRDLYGRSDYRQGPPGHMARDYHADYRDYRQGYPHEGPEHRTRYDYNRSLPYWGRPHPYYDENSRYYDSYGSRDPYGEYSVDPHYDPRYPHYPQDARRHAYYDYEYPEDSRHYYPHGQDPPEQYAADAHYEAADQYEYDEYPQEQHQPHQQPPTVDSAFSPEASAIYGRQEHFEISQFVDSPSARLPGRHSQQMQHESTAYHDPTAYYDQEYAEGAYEQYDGGYVEEAPWAPIPQPATPPPPSRQTPELFAHPHVRACFGFGGQLVTVLPNNPGARQPATVQICCLKDLVEDSGMRAFIEAVEASPGPLIPGDTPKGDVIQFTSREAEENRRKQQTEGDRQAAKNHEDEALLWDLLGLLCRQNGVALPVDISELLMRDRTVSEPMMAPTGARDGGSREEAMDALRKLLLAGRKKDALVLACDRALWGHGLMLASGMDEQSRTYVVNRFASSMMTMDPLNTFYTLLLGRIPSAVKPEGLHRAGDWRAHLAMMLANRTSKLENNCIVTLGDSLLSHGRLPAAHICYHFGYVPFGGYGNPEAKYSLLGVDHSHLLVGTYPEPAELWKMEVYEYAMSLSKHEFFLPTFQMYKFLHALKLAEVGFVEKALKYCEQIGYSVAKGPQSYPSSFLLPLLELSVKLYHTASPIGVVETELPSWLIQLQHSVADALSTDYTPSAQSSPSPAFSSVSQTYAATASQQQQQQPQQPIIGLGQYLSVPGGTRGSSSADLSTAGSSKEGSVTDLQLAIPKATQRGEVGATQGGEMLVDGVSANAEVGPIEQSQFAAARQGGAVDSPSNTGFQQAAFSGGEIAGAASAGFVQQPLYSASSGAFYSTGPQSDAIQGGHAQGLYQPQQQEQQGYGQQQPGGEATTSGAVTFHGDTSVQFGHGGFAADYGTMAGADAARQHPSQYGGQQAAVASTASEINRTNETWPVQGSYEGHESAFPQGSVESQPQTDTSAVFYWQQPQQQGPYGEQQLTADRGGAAELEAREGGAETAKSGDDHVTKSEQNEKETPEENGAKKEPKKKQSQPQSSGRGWGFNILKYVLPRRKNEVHLPDDSDKKIVWDDEKKRWKNVDADEEEEAGPAAPPTDMELRKSATGPQQQQGTDSTDGAPLMTGAPPSIGVTANKYSRQAKKGLRSKYVDVLNPGGTAGPSSAAAPPPPAVPLMVPATMTQPRFFVPQQPGNGPTGGDYGTTTGAEAAPEASQEDTPGASQGNDPATAADVPGKQAEQPEQSIQSNQFWQPEQPEQSIQSNQFWQPEQPEQSIQSNQFGQPEQPEQSVQSNQFGQASQFVHEQLPAGGVNSHEVNQHQLQPLRSTPLSFGVASGHSEQPQSFQQPPLQQETPRPAQQAQQQGSSSTTHPPPPPQQPQFFNPSAFGPVSSFSHAPGSDSQDDALSTVSTASELSQEVSRYMSKQPQVRVPTASAGYQRLRMGIRGARGAYPSLQQRPAAGQQQTAGRNPGGPPQQGPPPSHGARDFQQRHAWQ